MIKIPMKEYKILISKALKCDMLHNHGVDKWSGYNGAMADYDDVIDYSLPEDFSKEVE